jgi:hypothetical protein
METKMEETLLQDINVTECNVCFSLLSPSDRVCLYCGTGTKLKKRLTKFQLKDKVVGNKQEEYKEMARLKNESKYKED